jgi:hypothetical protein
LQSGLLSTSSWGSRLRQCAAGGRPTDGPTSSRSSHRHRRARGEQDGFSLSLNLRRDMTIWAAPPSIRHNCGTCRPSAGFRRLACLLETVLGHLRPSPNTLGGRTPMQFSTVRLRASGKTTEDSWTASVRAFGRTHRPHKACFTRALRCQESVREEMPHAATRQSQTLSVRSCSDHSIIEKISVANVTHPRARLGGAGVVRIGAFSGRAGRPAIFPCLPSRQTLERTIKGL